MIIQLTDKDKAAHTGEFKVRFDAKFGAWVVTNGEMEFCQHPDEMGAGIRNICFDSIGEAIDYLVFG